jgi:hypothetical protein
MYYRRCMDLVVYFVITTGFGVSFQAGAVLKTFRLKLEAIS